MTFVAAEGAFFYEDFSPDRASGFDPELDIAATKFALETGAISGFCNVAGRRATFAITDPNLRENLLSDAAGASARHRLLACGLSIAMFDTPLVGLPSTIDVMNARRKSVFLTETTTPFHNALRAQITPDLLTTSEYFGPEHRSGDFVGEVRHEDLQASSFADDTFDSIITSDVMEHVPDAIAAEREIIRILKPGGFYCFTVPLHAMAEADLLMAAMRPDGSIEYFAEPVYHGDPLRAEGALVFRIFSVREMHARFSTLGARCTTYRIWSKHFGILGAGCWVHVVRKPG